jgi:hypothetical protein
MTAVLDGVAVAVVAAALLLGAAALLLTRDARAALAILLDLLLVAGLLHLSASAAWTAIGTAALVVTIRKVVAHGLRAGRSALAEAAAPARRPG